MQDILSAVSLGSVYLLFALGMSVTWGTIDILNFAHGSTFMFSVFVAHVVLNSIALPFVAVLLIGVLVGAAISVLMQVLAFDQILRRAKSKRAAEMQILVGGIGVAIIPLTIAQHYTKSNAFGLERSTFAVDVWVLGGLRITNIMVITVIAAVVLWTAAALWLRRSRNGLALRAIGVDAETASLMGVNRGRLALVTMAVSGALGGLGGVLFTYMLGAISAEYGDTLLVKAFACIVLGGVGSMAGVAVGSFFLAGSETWVATQTSGSWVDAVSFGLIFLVLLLRPVGLFGRKEIRRT